MQLKDFYAAVGGNLEKVLTRLPDQAMVEKFLRRFPKDPSYLQLMQALKCADIPTAFRAAHTLKGTAATLGLDTLANAASTMTEQLRSASQIPAKEYGTAVDQAYHQAMAAIALLD